MSIWYTKGRYTQRNKTMSSFLETQSKRGLSLCIFPSYLCNYIVASFRKFILPQIYGCLKRSNHRSTILLRAPCMRPCVRLSLINMDIADDNIPLLPSRHVRSDIKFFCTLYLLWAKAIWIKLWAKERQFVFTNYSIKQNFFQYFSEKKEISDFICMFSINGQTVCHRATDANLLSPRGVFSVFLLPDMERGSLIERESLIVNY